MVGQPDHKNTSAFVYVQVSVELEQVMTLSILNILTQSARGPKKNVQKTSVSGLFSWEILKHVLKRTSYVRPEKNVLCTSWKEHFMYVVNRTSDVRLKDVVFKSLIFFLSHSLGNFLMYVMCYQLQKTENNKYHFQKFPIINCIFAQKNLSFFAII